MISQLINFFFRRNRVSRYLHRIEKLISEKKFCEADACAFLALQNFPNHPELLKLKAEAEKGFQSYLYSQEF